MKLLKSIILTAFTVLLFVQCSDDTDQLTTQISGTAVKGPVANATVTVYDYSDSGVRGEVLTSTNSAEDGSFEVTVNHVGVVEIVVTGGSYMDEASSKKVNLGNFELRSIIDAQGSVNTGITALTTIAASYIDENASSGLAIAIENAERGIVDGLGIGNVDIQALVPSDLTLPIQIENSSDMQQAQYAAVQSGFSQLIESNGLNPEMVLTLIEDFARDYEDGKFDGRSGTEAIEYVSGITPGEAIQGLETAIRNFMNSDQNNSGVSFSDIFSN